MKTKTLVIALIIAAALLAAWSWQTASTPDQAASLWLWARMASWFRHIRVAPPSPPPVDDFTRQFCQDKQDQDNATCDQIGDAHRRFCCILQSSCSYSSCVGDAAAYQGCTDSYERQCGDIEANRN